MTQDNTPVTAASSRFKEEETRHEVETLVQQIVRLADELRDGRWKTVGLETIVERDGKLVDNRELTPTGNRVTVKQNTVPSFVALFDAICAWQAASRKAAELNP